MQFVQVFSDELRLGFVCPACGSRDHMSPDDLKECGTPVCIQCEEDMDFESAFVSADRVCTDVQW